MGTSGIHDRLDVGQFTSLNISINQVVKTFGCFMCKFPHWKLSGQKYFFGFGFCSWELKCQTYNNPTQVKHDRPSHFFKSYYPKLKIYKYITINILAFTPVIIGCGTNFMESHNLPIHREFRSRNSYRIPFSTHGPGLCPLYPTIQYNYGATLKIYNTLAQVQRDRQSYFLKNS